MAKLLYLCGVVLFFGCQEPPASSVPITGNGIAPGQQEVGAPKPVLVTTVGFAGDASTLPGEAKVFVYARAVGTTMPLAVEMFAPADLPAQVGFSKPSESVEQVELVVRLSLTGAVMKHPHDVEVVSSPISLDHFGQRIQLLIPGESNQPDMRHDDHGLQLRVLLSPDIEIPDNSRVFVIAKEQNAAKPLPIAVKAFAIDSIAQELILSDKDSMTPVARLSNHAWVEVVARLSMGGQTQRRPGDWESESLIVATRSQEPVVLRVTRLVE